MPHDGLLAGLDVDVDLDLDLDLDLDPGLPERSFWTLTIADGMGTIVAAWGMQCSE
jgi:hypothetical protein